MAGETHAAHVQEGDADSDGEPVRGVVSQVLGDKGDVQAYIGAELNQLESILKMATAASVAEGCHGYHFSPLC